MFAFRCIRALDGQGCSRELHAPFESASELPRTRPEPREGDNLAPSKSCSFFAIHRDRRKNTERLARNRALLKTSDRSLSFRRDRHLDVPGEELGPLVVHEADVAERLVRNPVRVIRRIVPDDIEQRPTREHPEQHSPLRIAPVKAGSGTVESLVTDGERTRLRLGLASSEVELRLFERVQDGHLPRVGDRQATLASLPGAEGGAAPFSSLTGDPPPDPGRSPSVPATFTHMARDLRATGHEQAWSWPLADWDRMWKPSRWLKRPPRPHKAHLFHLVAILVLASYANIVANKLLDDAWHIPFNLGVLAAALLIARRAGTTWTSMGLRKDQGRRSIEVGTVVIAVIAAAVALGVALPATRALFNDDRIVSNSVGWVLFQAVVRVPLATALYEEVLFRGIVFGMLIRRYSPLVAALISSTLFGLWHTLPTMDTLHMNPAGTVFTEMIGLGGAIAGAIAGTFVAGLGFLWIRLYANSTFAAVLAHIGTNSVAMLGSLVVVHLLS